MRLSGAWLSRAPTQAVLAAISAQGHRALLVGGCVRNALMGLTVGDIDIATDALPDQVQALAQRAGLRAVPTGIAHGTITVVADGIGHEVTTFRHDLHGDGRHAIVSFQASLGEDAARRDFTMNALYANAQGDVIDPLGLGLADLAARRLRFVGDAHARICEDYLRILRFFRFYAQYGNPDVGPDPEALAACAAHCEGLSQLSRERIGAEMRKLLAAPNPAPALGAMAATGVLARVLPGADPAALAVLVHFEAAMALPTPANWLRRLAVLGGQDPQTALRLSRAESRDLANMVAAIGAPDGPAVLAYWLGLVGAGDVLALRAAIFEQPPDPAWREALAQGAAARFPVSSSDLMPGLQGPALGARLRMLEDRWIGSGFVLERADLLALPDLSESDLS